MEISTTLAGLKGGLIVSCQALPDEPLHGAQIMAAMAKAAAQGGAVAIRANGPTDIAAIHAAVSLPLIGLYKENIPGYPVYITPTIAHASAVAGAGANIVALDATFRPRPDGLDAAAILQQAKSVTGCLVLADIATYEEGLAAWRAGADVVSTTLSGYTTGSQNLSGPDFDLLERLACDLPIPVIAEGRISTPEQAARALDLGAWAVVVGAAITRPQVITRRFIDAITSRSGS